MRSLVLIVALMAMSVARPRRVCAQQPDIIRGRVTASGADTTGLTGVTVRATSASGAITHTFVTRQDGGFTIAFNDGEGDYWVEFTKIGFAPQRREIRRLGSEAVLIINARMVSVVATLDSVTTTGQRGAVRGVPNRNTADPDVSGAARVITGANLPPDLAGNLAAMVDGLPGLQIIPGLDGAPDMFSALGLDGNQNSTTFDGIGSGITALPPDVIGKTTVSTVSYDPATGGFGGAQIAVSTRTGTNFSQRLISHGNLLPPLQWTDAVGAGQAQKYTSLRLGGNASGPLVHDKAFYSTSWNVSRRANDARTLFDTDPAALASVGVASDSAARLTSILLGEGVPLSLPRIPGLQQLTAAQLQGNLNFAPSSAGTGSSFIVAGVGNYARSAPTGISLLTMPSHAGASERWAGSGAVTHTRYFGVFGVGVLSTTKLGLSWSQAAVTPYLTLPEGSVRVRSTLDDGTSPVRSLLFGGNTTESENRTSALQAQNALSWFSADNRHTFKLTSALTRSTVSTDNGAGTPGRFGYNSLDDLSAGRPATFTRTLSHQTQSASELTAAASLSDYWRPSANVQLQYGLRIDANRFATAPEFNDGVLADFGLRNDVVPNAVYVSPRVGFQWSYGVAPTVAAMKGGARLPAAVVHAGAGVFQNIAGPQLIGGALTSTGLPSSTQTLSCAGNAVPVPDWAAFLKEPALIPTRCADGSVGTVFSTTAPNVSLFDSRYRQPRSLRGSMDWTGPILDNRFMLGAQVILTHAVAQSGTIDINVDTTTRFTLGNEGGRPVFADPAAIVPATGVIAPADGRLSPGYQRVSVTRSDLRLDSHLFTVSVAPVTPSRWLKWTLTYSLLDGGQTFYGFNSTAGNPFDIERGALLQQGRQALTLTWNNLPAFDLLYVSASVRLASGGRYTPRVSGDINGDGLANDRAYAFDPSTISASDPGLAAGMRSLLASGSPSARQCLTKQLGSLTGFGSCQAPGTATTSLQIRFNPAKIGLPKRATLALGFQNPLALADLALHGSGNVHGWGQAIQPDPTLLFVRGFDPVTRQFAYDVNERFGSTRPQQSAGRTISSLSVSMSIDVGMPRERQLLSQRLDAGRSRPGAKADDRSIWGLGVASIPNPMSMILQADSALQLTRVQADSLATLSLWFSAYADSVWTPAARHLAALPGDYDRGEAYATYVRARERTVDHLIELVPHVKGILTVSQWRKLPLSISIYLDERVLKFLRSSTAGDIGALIGR